MSSSKESRRAISASPTRWADHERHHLPSLSDIAVLGEDPRRVRDQEARLALGRDPEHDAQAGFDAHDRRLSQDSGDADRRRHFLRYADHPARVGAALPVTIAVSL